MGKVNPYSVTLYPAKRENGFVVTRVELFSGKTYPEKAFTANSVQAMVAEVTAFAEEHGEPCSAHVTCHATRKPPGFKKATDGLYFNLDRAEAA